MYKHTTDTTAQTCWQLHLPNYVEQQMQMAHMLFFTALPSQCTTVVTTAAAWNAGTAIVHGGEHIPKGHPLALLHRLAQPCNAAADVTTTSAITLSAMHIALPKSTKHIKVATHLRSMVAQP